MVENNEGVNSVVAAFSTGFVDTLRRVDNERQLIHPVERQAFRNAYDTAYFDYRKHIVNDYGKSQLNPLRHIGNSDDAGKEARKQALLIIGATMVRQNYNATRVAEILEDLGFRNGLYELSSYEVVPALSRMSDYLDELLKDK